MSGKTGEAKRADALFSPLATRHSPLACLLATRHSRKLLPLPDYLRPGLEVVFVGFNPGARSARLGHYYAGIGNLFWPGLCQSGLISTPLRFADDWRLPDCGIGLTDLAKQPSRSIADLPAQQFRHGREALRRKIRRVKPQVIAFVGKGVYELFTGVRCSLGPQTGRICGAAVFVLPSTSARNASVSRQQKLQWFCRLNQFVRTIRSESRTPARQPRRQPGPASGSRRRKY